MRDGDLSNVELKKIFIDLDSLIINGEYNEGLLATVPHLFGEFNISFWAPWFFIKKHFGVWKFLRLREELQFGEFVSYSKATLKVVLKLEKAIMLTANPALLEYLGKYARDIRLLDNLGIVKEMAAKEEIEQINWFNRMGE